MISTQESAAIDRASNLDVYSIEGIDGSGKSTFIDYFCKRLESLHKEPLLCMRLPIKAIKLIMIEDIDKILSSKQDVDMQILQAANATVVKLWQHRKDNSSCRSSTDNEASEQPAPIDQLRAIGAMHDNYEDSSTADSASAYPVYVLDRGRASYYAYQIYAKDNAQLVPYLLESMRSDIGYHASPEYIWLDISAELAQKSIDTRGNPTGFDKASLDFKEKLRAGYSRFFTYYDTHCLKIPVDQIRSDYSTIDECNEAIFQLWCEKYLSRLIDKINRRFRRFN